MDYKFPIINRIEDVIPHVEKYEAFNILSKDGGYTIIDYAVDNPEIFDRKFEGWEIRRECRGITFDTATGLVVRRPFHKFFNLNQKEETLFEVVQPMITHEVKHYMKEDGSMIAPFQINDNLFWGTRRGVTEQVGIMQANVYTKIYDDSIRHILSLGITPAFEFVSPNNKIVLDYETSDLVLTAAREMVSGNYVDINDSMFDGFNRVKEFKVVQGTSFEEIMEMIRVSKGIEGIVSAFPNGHRIKLKGEEYVFLHKSKERISVEKELWTIVLDGTLDDFIPKIDVTDVPKVREVEKEVWDYVNKYVSYIKILLSKAEKDYDSNKKRIALEWKDLKGYERDMVFKGVDGKDILKETVDLFLKHTNKVEKQNDFKQYLDKIKIGE